MQIITKEEFKLRQIELLEKIKQGAIFIHPTDTIYGIGCNALDSHAVRKIREIKGRPTTPFSVIAPSKEWIIENTDCKQRPFKAWLQKLPGPYTLICKLSNEGVVSEEVNPEINTLGVRIPDHWISDVVNMAQIPIVTTSANKISKICMTSLENLDPEIKAHLDFIIYEGEKKGRPSKIVYLDTHDEILIRER